MERTAFIYQIHFDVPLAHAQHYTGCTHDLRGRLMSHAEGRGSNLCRELMKQGIEWRLGSVATCNHRRMRELERLVKSQHNGPRFCNLCMGIEARRIPGTTPYPIEAIRFPTTSQHLRGISDYLPVSYRFADGRSLPLECDLRTLSNADKDNLGFIPMTGTGGIAVALDNGRVILAEQGGKVVGYLLFTENDFVVTIHQTVIEDRLREEGHGRAMVEMLRLARPEKVLQAKVRSDLAANYFWQAIGFKMVESYTHKTSGSTLNVYQRRPSECGTKTIA